MNKRILLILCISLFSMTQDSFSQDKSGPSDYRSTIEKLVNTTLKKNDAFNKLEQLCDDVGNRLSGSKSLDKAIQWAVKTLKRDGHENVHTEDVMVPRWVRGKESATMLEPRIVKLTMLGLGGSVGTPEAGVTGQVIVVHSRKELEELGDKVKGKIVLYNVPMPKYDPVKGAGYGETVRYRTQGARWAAKQGAIAALVRSVTARSLQSAHTGGMRYGKGQLKIPNAALSVENTELLDRLCKRGKKVVVRLKMAAKNHPKVKSANVIAEIKGSKHPEEIIVIGGHIDSWDVGQGAQDDGAGCVIAMEALHRIRKLGLKPKRTIRLVLWTNEENGLAGARQYVETHKNEMDKHIAAIESDSGGFQPLGFKIDHKDDHQKAAIIKSVQAILDLVPSLGKRKLRSKAGYAGADINPIKFFGATTLGLWVDGSTYFDYHHTQSDTLDKVDPRELSRGAALMAAMAYVLADMPGRLDNSKGRKKPAVIDQSKATAVASALLNAYKNKNFSQFVSLVRPGQSKWTKSLLKVGTPVYESLFGKESWRWSSVSKWDGKLGPARISHSKAGSEARIRFAELGQSDCYVIQLKEGDKKWYFVDIIKMPQADFNGWGAAHK
jgi:carboxypeptidase Q